MQEFLNRVLHGNNVEIMAYMPNECVDLTITSPPYDKLRNYKGFEFPFENIAKELYRVTKQGGIVVWVVSDATIEGSETGSSFKQALYFKEMGFNLHDTMIWLKSNPMPQIKRMRYTNTFEYMFVFSKGKPKTCNYLTEPCKNAGKDMSKSSFKNYSANEQKRFIKNIKVKSEKIKSNVWQFKIGKGSGDDEFSKSHPAVFPEQLVQDHILSWSNEGEVVLDCMCGSGTTLKMAHLNNRNFIGIDYSKEYVELSQKRLEGISE